jgi:hypothetical protein
LCHSVIKFIYDNKKDFFSKQRYRESFRKIFTLTFTINFLNKNIFERYFAPNSAVKIAKFHGLP